MKFIVDAQLPASLAKWLQTQGFDAIHTLDLPNKNFTSDVDIIALSMAEERMVISKDYDFFEYYLLKGEPHKLLFITVGNIVNRELLNLFELNWSQLYRLAQQYTIIEMNQYKITVHF